MRILCPLCGFGREIDETKIPPRAQMATCPKCAHKFRFRVVDDLDAAPPATPAGLNAPGTPGPLNVTGGFPGGGAGGPSAKLPGGQDLSATQPDPMAAQRAAASQAWRRLQGPDAAPGSGPELPTPDLPAAGGDADSAGRNGAPLPTAPTSSAPAGQDAPATEGPASALNAAPASRVPFEDLPRHGFFPGMPLLWVVGQQDPLRFLGASYAFAKAPHNSASAYEEVPGDHLNVPRNAARLVAQWLRGLVISAGM